MRLVSPAVFETLPGKVLFTVVDYDSNRDLYIDRPGLYLREGDTWDRGTLERGMHVSDVLETESNSRRYVDDGVDMFQPILDICPIKDEVDSNVYYRVFSVDDVKEIIKNLSTINGV